MRNHDAAYHGLHRWMNRHHPRTGTCERCGATGCRTELAEMIPGARSLDRADWQELCVPCHQAYDGYAVQRAGGQALAGRAKSAAHRAALSVAMKQSWQRRRQT